jgi:hypothetical protein
VKRIPELFPRTIHYLLERSLSFYGTVEMPVALQQKQQLVIKGRYTIRSFDWKWVSNNISPAITHNRMTTMADENSHFDCRRRLDRSRRISLPAGITLF